jgi:hypothetical protein
VSRNLDQPEEPAHEPKPAVVPEQQNFGKTEYEWAWELHKNCDNLLHQRLASFTAAQAMTLAAFTLLTVARFNASDKIPQGRLDLLETAGMLVLFLGLITAIMGYLVTRPMFKRLEILNIEYLAKNPVYARYRDAPGPRWRLYKIIIPDVLPAVEIGFWIYLLYLLNLGVSVGAAVPGAG